MNNPAREWLEKLNLKSISYNDFPIERERDYYFLQKIDGEHNTLVYERGKSCYFITKGGKIKTGLYVLSMYQQALDKRKDIQSIIIPGELVGFYKGRILPFNQSIHVIRNSKNSLSLNKMTYHFAYDIYKLNNENINFPHSLQLIAEYLYPTQNVNPIFFYKGDLSRAWNHFTRVPGVEGLVARNGTNYKIKLTYDVDLVMVAVGGKNMKNWPKGKISYIVGAFMDEQGRFILTSKIGTGFDDETSRKIFKWAYDHKVHDTADEIWVEPKMIFESTYRNVYKTKNAVMVYKNNKYHNVGFTKSYNLFLPSFQRFRPDKHVIPADLRLGQIPDTIIGKQVNI
jgi:ATP-dependent DNA ligase